jgi:hypothetical protein
MDRKEIYKEIEHMSGLDVYVSSLKLNEIGGVFNE